MPFLSANHRLNLPALSPLYYITALTALFESIALIVDQHQPVVEKYYGSGKMGLVLERLLQEADRVVQDLLEGWEEERSMKRKVCRDLRIRSAIYLTLQAFSCQTLHLLYQ